MSVRDVARVAAIMMSAKPGALAFATCPIRRSHLRSAPISAYRKQECDRHRDAGPSSSHAEQVSTLAPGALAPQFRRFRPRFQSPSQPTGTDESVRIASIPPNAGDAGRDGAAARYDVGIAPRYMEGQRPDFRKGELLRRGKSPVVQRRRHQRRPKVGTVDRPLPLLVAHDHSLSLAVTGDDRRLSLHRLIHYRRQARLGITELNFAHWLPPDMTRS